MSSTKILIVEDERIVALSIQNKLERLGYTVTANVASGEAAIESIAPNCPHLVLMDIKLKGKVDGIEAASQIRHNFQLPIVYLTAYNDDDTIERAKLTEPYGYLLKPFESRDLATTIEIALYKHQMEQQLRDREQWLATTLNSIGDAVIATNPQGSIVFMNPVAETITGWKEEEVLNRNLSDVFRTIHETTREVVENPVSLALHQCTRVGMANSTLLITRDGREIPIDCSAAPIKNETGNILGAVLVFHDVTEERKIKSILEQTNEELELRVAESTAQLRAANAQLKAEIAQRQRLENELQLALAKERELNELKSRIVATVSHEYRTPLTTILSSTELLENYADKWSPEKKQRHFQRIQESVHHLTKLVNDMIFIDQAQTRKLEFHPAPLDVVRLISEIVEAFRCELTDEYSILFQSPVICQKPILDRDLLEIIISNLLSNAIKYSPNGGPILLELIYQESEIAIRVSDKGIGIPTKDKPHLFKSLFRGSNIDLTPGVGLGLVIVKEAVDLHGGKISVESEVGVGTTFTVILPFAPGV
ncbi:MAG TPA: hybrid sensor histidine kinase/response regulator [Cyanobacteria bacterium UBA11149]|nr:hybrid sensor histidine kinase/response regulator [Cyanobacteria bacterium UBA11367]HBE58223.1 hybrid sensor histidine kinase/response regulator [Cyanobacteria bacterium UBA11366]HBK66918.1 hybrid sensor histidine kinase/response regulator [Cyanobacteria bacterium UBA11166]HBR76173.1 hybrid sensor histidine kinase/response regulator [Cyanobacteria bacterium UBA11159]HBS70749.1 hybrid sensor histidine kinase/response regulator [Cyanobacteria bacterium UBA11153]HBW88560.1 hybrid sensor histid